MLEILKSSQRLYNYVVYVLAKELEIPVVLKNEENLTSISYNFASKTHQNVLSVLQEMLTIKSHSASFYDKTYGLYENCLSVLNDKTEFQSKLLSLINDSQQIENSIEKTFHSACIIDLFRYYEDYHKSIIDNSEIQKNFQENIKTNKAWNYFIDDQMYLLDSKPNEVVNIYKKLSDSCTESIEIFNTLALHSKALIYSKKILNNIHTPMSINPIFISKKKIIEMKSKQILHAKVMSTLARREDVLQATLLKHPNTFMKRLYQTRVDSKKLPEEDLELIIMRNDFMLNKKDNTFKQIEINMIAAGMGVVAEYATSFLANLNPYLSDRVKLPLPEILINSVAHIQQFKKAYELYCATYKPNKKPIILIYTGTIDPSIHEQYTYLFGLHNHGIPTKKIYQDESLPYFKLTEDKRLLFKDDEVALVYFRHLYNEDQYTEEIWKVRTMIESSKAISCPNVISQIANMKLFQYYLAKKEFLKELMGNQLTEEEINLFCQNQAEIKIFSDFQSDLSIFKNYITSQPLDKFVLKSQKEGGGANLFDADIVKFLNNLKDERDLHDYILMEKLFPHVSLSVFARENQFKVLPSVSEIGFFSSYIIDQGKLTEFVEGDIFIRTKYYKENEGGITIGAAHVDSYVAMQKSGKKKLPQQTSWLNLLN